jgi:hypothetical protein
MPAKKQAGKRKAAAEKTFRARGREVRVSESARGLTIRIDGHVVPGVRRLSDGSYHTEFLPFLAFSSATEVARALAAQAGRTFALGRGARPAGDKGMSRGHS